MLSTCSYDHPFGDGSASLKMKSMCSYDHPSWRWERKHRACPRSSPRSEMLCVESQRPATTGYRNGLTWCYILDARPRIPGHALHEKQKRVGTLVSSQERRAAVVPRINQLSTAGFVPQSVYIRFRYVVRASEETFKTGAYDALERTRDGCLLGESIRHRPVLLGPASTRHPAVRCPDPTRPWYVRVWIRQVKKVFMLTSKRIVFMPAFA